MLFFANRSEDAIPFEEELEEFVALIPGLRVVHVLSQPGEAWQGYRGHLDQDILAAEIAGPGRLAVLRQRPAVVRPLRCATCC